MHFSASKNRKLGYYVFALRQIHIYEKLAWLNGLPADEAEYVFAECCGSAAFARLMSQSRPFPMLERLFAGAEQIWASLPADEKAIALGSRYTLNGNNHWNVVEARLAKLLER